MASWLGTWAKRKKITIDATKVDSNLTHFPVRVKISTSSGSGTDDVSEVFDELTSDANRTKIALTKDDGVTPLYCEIERWDDANELAELHISKSDWTLSSSGNTDFYLYYDTSQDANTAYVADVGSRTEVWDADHEAVYHLEGSYDGTGGEVTDSTSNNRDGTSVNTPVQSTGKIGKGQTFALANEEYISLPHFNRPGSLTVESWGKTPDDNTESMILAWSAAGGANDVIHLHIRNGGELRMAEYDQSGTSYLSVESASADYDDDAWHYFAVTEDATSAILYIDNASDNSGDIQQLAVATDTLYIAASNRAAVQRWWDGELDEIRISSDVRTAAWMKASYNSGNDSLINSFGNEEERPLNVMTTNTKYW